MVFKRQCIAVEDTIRRAYEDTKEWIENSTLGTAGEDHYLDKHVKRGKWKKPLRGWVKCNYDVSYHDGNQHSEIIRDNNGIFLEAGMGKFQDHHSVEESECSGLLWAMQASCSLVSQMVEFEGDNWNLIRTIQDNPKNLRLQHYMSAIRGWKIMFRGAKFSFSTRNSNICVVKLAREALTSSPQWYLYNSCSRFLIPVVTNDCEN